jgi:hypothetical protein
MRVNNSERPKDGPEGAKGRMPGVSVRVVDARHPWLAPYGRTKVRPVLLIRHIRVAHLFETASCHISLQAKCSRQNGDRIVRNDSGHPERMAPQGRGTRRYRARSTQGSRQFKNRFWRSVRVVEGARLESVYTLIAYRGFESLLLRQY